MEEIKRSRFASRRMILVVTLCLLAVLDIGRSLFARIGYAQPVSTWQPDPKTYADIAWPPGSGLAKNAALGARVYAQRCAVCHGPDGRGNGPAAPSLIPRPRDFTAGLFKYKSTAGSLPPSDEDLVRTVSRGLSASAMPFMHDILTDTEIHEVVAYIKRFSPVFNGGPSRAVAVPPRVAPTSDSIARGRELFRMNGCQSCHGEDARGGLTFRDNKGYPVISRDLTAPWTFRGGSAPEQIWLRITTGLAPSPMPSIADKTTLQERWDIVNYVVSLARTPPWQPGGKLEGPGQQADLTRRGEYLVHAEICGLCHTPIDRTGIYRADDFYLGGGMRVGAYPHGIIISSNLTSDLQTGLGKWSEGQIVDALRNGRARGRVLNVFDMPWAYLHHLTSDDATAIARYLKTLPPVYNRIPSTLRFGFIETVVDKLMRAPPAFPTTALTFADQQFGQTAGSERNWPQTWLIDAQWVVLLIGTLAFFFAAPHSQRLPSRIRGWLGLTGILVLGGVASLLYELPLLEIIPPDQIVNAVTAGVPATREPPIKGHEQNRLAERGRYLFTVASCALCHRNDGRGGLKVSWKPMGTLWSRNLTSDPETGLGRWSDTEIKRAIRSGVSRDGYQLHWQGMTWDHASNWDEEDIIALIAYLRMLPPIKNKIPHDRAPTADDCDIYTFWTSENQVQGCH